ncbi:Protein SENSITIVITY TO RED LIGHT REDUCED 1 [Durusdinium trenchii]|uniref:Protein SENSITIVITY TO RED LIGHT REDUCED 1 n=1 Tax=Durusdinium trenchii TaxID=1381693 RepID=A0ABP0R0C1_9DINO
MPRMSEAYLSRLGGVPGLDRLQAVEEEKQELLRRLEASGRRNQELELERQTLKSSLDRMQKLLGDLVNVPQEVTPAERLKEEIQEVLTLFRLKIPGAKDNGELEMASWWSSKGDYSEPPAWAGWQHYRLWKKSVLRRDKNTDGLKLHEKLSSDKITASANIMTFEEDLRKTTEKIGLLEKKKAILEKSRAKLETLESGLEESEKKISSDIEKGVTIYRDDTIEKERDLGDSFKRLESLLLELKTSVEAIPKGEVILEDAETEASIFSFAP